MSEGARGELEEKQVAKSGTEVNRMEWGTSCVDSGRERGVKMGGWVFLVGYFGVEGTTDMYVRAAGWVSVGRVRSLLVFSR